MTIYRIVRTAFKGFRKNPMRTFLTSLGIIIGIGAVIAMMEIGQGYSGAITKQIASMGANNLMIFPGASSSGAVGFGMGSAMTLTPQDAEAIIKDCPAVGSGTVIVRARGTQVLYGNKNWLPQQISGTTPAFLDVRNYTLDEGESFTDRDVRSASRVCLLGPTIAHALFGKESPIGKDIRVQNVTFKVIGVLSPKGANMGGQDQDDILLAPWTTIKYRVTGSNGGVSGSSSSSSSSTSSTVNTLSSLYPTSTVTLYPTRSDIQTADTPMPVKFANVDMIVVAAQSAQDIPQAIKQMTAVLRERHRIHEGSLEDFSVVNLAEMMQTMTQVGTFMTQLLFWVAFISLIVGGVGIMNIMLVSVTERTREIGLRMAVGAQGNDILRQFLVEAMVLCLTGGILGILVGHAGASIVTWLVHLPTATSISAIVISVVVSAGVGIIFGFYPAWKASRLDPIEALRYE